MDLQRDNTYSADPYAVFGMLTDREFLDRRAVATKAIRHRVEVAPGSDGTVTVRTQRTLQTDLIPDALRKLVGATIDIDETITWSAPEPDGSRVGRVELEVAKVPVSGTGTMRLVVDASSRTRQSVQLEIKASIPLVGRKVEEAAAPAVIAALEVEERLGGEWLAERS